MGGRGRGPPHEQRRRHVRPSSRAAQGQSVAAAGARAAGGSGRYPPREQPRCGACPLREPRRSKQMAIGRVSTREWLGFPAQYFFPLFQDVASSVEIEEIQQNLS